MKNVKFFYMCKKIERIAKHHDTKTQKIFVLLLEINLAIKAILVQQKMSVKQNKI